MACAGPVFARTCGGAAVAVQREAAVPRQRGRRSIIGHFRAIELRASTGRLDQNHQHYLCASHEHPAPPALNGPRASFRLRVKGPIVVPSSRRIVFHCWPPCSLPPAMWTQTQSSGSGRPERMSPRLACGNWKPVFGGLRGAHSSQQRSRRRTPSARHGPSGLDQRRPSISNTSLNCTRAFRMHDPGSFNKEKELH